MKKKLIYIIIIVVTVFITLLAIYLGVNKSNKKITKYIFNTHEYFSYYGTNQYMINSMNEYYIFGKIYSNSVDNYLKEHANIDNNTFKDYTLFIQVKGVSSGSIKIEFKEVSFKNNAIVFETDMNRPEVGTNDMATWYLIALIPNDKLKGIDTKEWSLPTQIYANIPTWDV